MSTHQTVDLRLMEIALLEQIAKLALRHANARFPGSQDAFKAQFDAGRRIGMWAQAIDDYAVEAAPPIPETRGDTYRPTKGSDK